MFDAIELNRETYSYSINHPFSSSNYCCKCTRQLQLPMNELILCKSDAEKEDIADTEDAAMDEEDGDDEKENQNQNKQGK